MKNLLFSLSLIFVIFTSCKPEDELQITSISFDSTQVTLNEGESVTLTVKYFPTNLPAPSYTWVSLSPNIATVDNGIVKAISAGTTKIRVTSLSNQSLTAECTIVVKILGTSDNPYLIYTVQDLLKIRDSINSGNLKYSTNAYKLMADLDFSNEHYWTPIGPSETVSFKGIFDGNGKVIRNINIGTSNTTVSMGYAGFFGYLNGGNVKSLGIQWNKLNASGITGGIAGQIINGSKIDNCYSTGGFFNNSYCGGIVGMVTDGEINNCYFTGSITKNTDGSFTNSGGIAGNISDGKINNCYSTSNITGYYSGGIVGNASNIITMSDCYSSGDVSGYNSGGVIGKIIKGATITNCHSSGNITSFAGLGPSVGGIVGFAEDVQINNCYSTGNINGDGSGSNCGGILGFARSGSLINCYANGNIKSDGYAGGIAGNMKGNIYNCYAIGDVSVFREVSSYAGGISGVQEGIIYNCYSAGSISSTSYGSVFGSTYNSFASGIASSAGIVRYCIALNDTIIAKAYDFNSIYPQRIAIGNSSNSNNYAATTMVVIKRTTTITSFPNVSKNGLDLTGNPVELLNNYVTANPSYNGITLLKWKVETGVNNGNPIFQ